jgi:hypothetical protein
MYECESRRGFVLDIRITDRTALVTRNYSPIAEFNDLQITVKHTLVFSICY